MEIKQRLRGSLFGLAMGDALAAPAEFMKLSEILERWPPAGPMVLEGDPARVTDDTQMALAVACALQVCSNTLKPVPAVLEAALVEQFVAWLVSPENNRAPGMTCLRACEALEKGQPWQEAMLAGSKGCGANMRVWPVAAMLHWAPETRAAVAQFQAVLTHGHPTALAASDATAFAIHALLQGAPLAKLKVLVSDYAHSQREVYHEAWLGTCWQRPYVPSAQVFISRGWDEVLECLARLPDQPGFVDPEDDPCLVTGEGWSAEEALVTAMACAMSFPNDPVLGLRRAAATCGDSDSIASITGALLGAALGDGVWPTSWYDCLEYRELLEQAAQAPEIS